MSVGEICVESFEPCEKYPFNLCYLWSKKIRLALIYSIFNHKYNYTADDGYGEESETEPCGDDAECKGYCSCDGR